MIKKIKQVNYKSFNNYNSSGWNLIVLIFCMGEMVKVKVHW